MHFGATSWLINPKNYTEHIMEKHIMDNHEMLAYLIDNTIESYLYNLFTLNFWPNGGGVGVGGSIFSKTL